MKNKKNKKFVNQNQKSFFFEDFLETSQRQKNINKSKISDDRLYVLFCVFFSLILIFSTSIFSISIQSSNFNEYKDNSQNSLMLRRDIVDRNGELIARNINTYHAAIKPNLTAVLAIALSFFTPSFNNLRASLFALYAGKPLNLDVNLDQ